MSWLFSQALVEEYSADICLDGQPYAQLNVMPTPHKFWHKDKTMEFSSLSRFGLTLKLLTEDRGAELLISYLEDSRAKTLVRKGGGMDLTEKGLECGRKWIESSMRYDRERFTWKTHLSLWDEDLPQSLLILPSLGMTRAGVVYQHPTAERPICATESGSTQRIPTPMASDWKGGTVSIRKDKGTQRLDQFRDWIKCLHGLTYPIPEHSEAVMGWPIGWSDLKPLGMDKFREWQQQHSIFYEE